MHQPAPAQGIPAQPPALAPGKLLSGRYFIQGYIGGGGFGHIYKAQDKVLGHRRAIKEAFFRDTYTQQQFRFEAEFLLNARHSNLVRGYSFFEQEGRFYLVMDYVDGFTLEEIAIRHIRTTGRPLSEAQVLDWVIPICDAVHSLHLQPAPIIHRDIKPANIKLTRANIPILIDLGLAKLYSAGTQTISAALAFTPGYAPPEQYQASGATDPRTDVYALGATLYYLLTGYQPTESPARLSQRALPAPRALNHNVSLLTDAAVLKAMSLNPADRQQSAAALLEDLRAARATLEASHPTVNERRVSSVSRSSSCVNCGTASLPDGRFCLHCGYPFAAIVSDESASEHDVSALHISPTTATSSSLQQTHEPRSKVAHSPMSPADARIPGPTRMTFASPGAGALALSGLAPISERQDAAKTQEALTVIAATLALVCLSLSLLTFANHWLLITLVPALALAHWSRAHEHMETPIEFRHINSGVLVGGYLWFTVWLIMLVITLVHH